MCGECVGVGVGLWWRGREGGREGEREGGRERERERERVEGGGGARCMRWQCQLINTWVWLLKAREVTVTLVTSLRREGIREATKTLL